MPDFVTGTNKRDNAKYKYYIEAVEILILDMIV